MRSGMTKYQVCHLFIVQDFPLPVSVLEFSTTPYQFLYKMTIIYLGRVVPSYQHQPRTTDTNLVRIERTAQPKHIILSTIGL